MLFAHKRYWLQMQNSISYLSISAIYISLSIYSQPLTTCAKYTTKAENIRGTKFMQFFFLFFVVACVSRVLVERQAVCLSAISMINTHTHNIRISEVSIEWILRTVAVGFHLTAHGSTAKPPRWAITLVLFLVVNNAASDDMIRFCELDDELPFPVPKPLSAFGRQPGVRPLARFRLFAGVCGHHCQMVCVAFAFQPRMCVCISFKCIAHMQPRAIQWMNRNEMWIIWVVQSQQQG